MSRAKVFPSISMILILIALSGISVWAAPGGQEADQISGVVTAIVIEVGEDGTSTVLVTLEDGQEVRLSLETAIALGLVEVDENGDPVLDEDGNPIPNEDMTGQPVEIDPNDVIEEDEEGWHPVASALAEFFVEYLPEFFTDILDLDYETVMGYHEDGMGFGVIAQACWMSSMLYDSEAEDNITPGDILEAKKAHDFDSITLSEDGEPMITLPNGEVPTNWGQFRKAVLGSEKGQKNLGAIMSGRAKKEQEQEQEQEQEMTATQAQGKDKGGGKPNTPPGQDKDKGKGGDKDKGGGKGKNK